MGSPASLLRLRRLLPFREEAQHLSRRVRTVRIDMRTLATAPRPPVGAPVHDPMLRDRPPGVVVMQRPRVRVAVRGLPALHDLPRGAHGCAIFRKALQDDIVAIGRMDGGIRIAMKHDDRCHRALDRKSVV